MLLVAKLLRKISRGRDTNDGPKNPHKRGEDPRCCYGNPVDFQTKLLMTKWPKSCMKSF